MKIFEGLEWRSAFRRAAIFLAIWLLSIYVLSVAFPGSFGLGFNSSAEVFTLLFYGVFFFFFFAVLTAFTERSKKRSRARHSTESKTQNKDKSGLAEDGETRTGNLKGRHNPNTSRKKATRRRRR
jgi:hypothetical protein